MRQRVAHPRIHFAFIAVKALEAWYLADSAAMNAWLETDDFHEPIPEATPDKPWERLKQVAAERDKRGPGNKVAFAKRQSNIGALASKMPPRTQPVQAPLN